jgi:hypothetical protein
MFIPAMVSGADELERFVTAFTGDGGYFVATFVGEFYG